MAEIRVEPQRRSKGWIWLLVVVIVVAALGWYLYTSRTTSPSNPSAPTATP
jgi:hypothetical protein